MSDSLAGSRIDMNERLPTSTRQTFYEARRAGTSGSCMDPQWTHLREAPPNHPHRLHHRDHLETITARDPQPISAQPAMQPTLPPGALSIFTVSIRDAPTRIPAASGRAPLPPSVFPLRPSLPKSIIGGCGTGPGAIPKRSSPRND